MLDKFKWGPSFISINLDLLEAYSACANSTEIVAVQNAHIERCEAEQAAKEAAGPSADLMTSNPNRQNRRLDLPPTWSDEELEEAEESNSEDASTSDAVDSEEDAEDDASSSEEAESSVRSAASQMKSMRV